MALVKCTECGNDVSDLASNCPKCGAPVAKPKPPEKSHFLLITFAVIAVVFVFFMVMGTTDPTTKEKGDARRAIDLCWDEQGKKSLTPGDQRFIAGACEMMEKKFETKYGVKP